MWFQIESVQADGQWVPLSYGQNGNWLDNTFTMVVGQNAVGKSRLLRKIVSNYIFAQDTNTNGDYITSTKSGLHLREQHTNYSLQESYEWNEPTSLNENWSSSPEWEYHSDGTRTPNLQYIPKQFLGTNKPGEGEIDLSFGSALCPSNVIAVSTGRHDRFPSLGQSKRNPSGIEYCYISSERPNGSSVPNSLGSLIDGLLRGQQNISRLTNILEYLGFEPYLDMKISLETRQLARLSEVERSELYYKSDFGLINYLTEENQLPPYLDLEQYKFFETLRRQKKSHLEIHVWDFEERTNREILRALSVLLRFSLIKIYDITLVKSNTKSRLRLSQASSGQQCMLTMMLGIAGSIQNGSLICIDEPEISLHPQWQSNLVKQLQEVFSDYHGCHFIIATHSPQLVSGLVTENGYVLNLEEKRLYKSHEYAKRSADFQLAEIFQSPGQNNEYLLRTTLILLTKISKREDFNREDRDTIEKLFQIQKKMSNTDPVYHLICQLEALY